jgi:hypothetical protein
MSRPIMTAFCQNDMLTVRTFMFVRFAFFLVNLPLPVSPSQLRLCPLMLLAVQFFLKMWFSLLVRS